MNKDSGREPEITPATETASPRTIRRHHQPKQWHIGPMAQDFHAAFGLNGADDRHISVVDIAGVNLAAIQELDSQMKIKDAQIAELKAQAVAHTAVEPNS